MSDFLVSARKYRPNSFDSVVGQPSIVTTLKNAIKTDQLAQAFLFCGPRGVGKTSTARILAKTINCQNLEDSITPCNQCESCKSFNTGQSINIYELDAASNNSVDDIRRLVDQVRYPPSGKESKKIYIIDEVHMLSTAAFNAFLKTLEEPPKYAIFILATTEKQKIIPTILSRCQLFHFKAITLNDIANKLEDIAKDSQVDYEPEALNIIAQKAHGGMRDALSMFDQIVSFTNKHLTKQSVSKILNVLDQSLLFELVEAFKKHDISTCLLALNTVIENGFEEKTFITELARHLRNILVAKHTSTINLLNTDNASIEEYITQAEKLSTQNIYYYIDILNQVLVDLKTALDQRLTTEIGLMQLCSYSQNEEGVKKKS